MVWPTWAGVRLRRVAPQPLVGATTVVVAIVAVGVAWWQAPVALSAVVALTAGALVAAIALANRFPLPIRLQQKLYMASVPLYVLAVLVPPPLAALSAGLGWLGGELLMVHRRRNAPGTIASEVGRWTLVVLAGALVAHLPGPRMVWLVLTAGVLCVGDWLSSPLGMGPLTGEPPLRLIVTLARRAALVEGTQYLLGLIGVLAASRQTVALVLLALPAGLLYLSLRAIISAEGAHERAERTARSRDEFLRAVAHDLRTPLTILLLHVEAIADALEASDHPDADRLWRRTQSITTAGARMVDSLEEITDMTRLQLGEPLHLHLEVLDLGAQVHAVVNSMDDDQPRAAVSVEAPTQVLARADRRQLERVLHNVIGNAVKYSPDHTPVQVTVAQDDQWATITVQDRGVGIPREELPYIFTAFYRASTARGFPGAGIGLAGSKMLVEQHGGTISIDSVMGHGTTVTMRLPRANVA